MKRATLLMIDDDKLNGQLILKRLEKRGYVCHLVTSGVNALADIDSLAPDLILLDKMMPEKSGQEVLADIREKFDLFSLPVIMLTAKTEPEELVESLKAGANDYLMKPPNIDITIARIETQVRLKKMYAENSVARQNQAVNAMIVTFNHEINNPLMVATGSLNLIKRKHPDMDFSRIEDSHERIQGIVKKIEKTANQLVEFDDYTSTSKMVKLVS